MKKMQSFLTMYYILGGCFGQCHEDDLACVLSSMNPELWEGGMPMDKWFLNEWTRLNEPETVNTENVFEKTENFVDFLIKDNWRLNETKVVLQRLNRITTLAEVEDKVKKLYEINKYSD